MACVRDAQEVGAAQSKNDIPRDAMQKYSGNGATNKVRRVHIAEDTMMDQSSPEAMMLGKELIGKLSSKVDVNQVLTPETKSRSYTTRRRSSEVYNSSALSATRTPGHKTIDPADLKKLQQELEAIDDDDIRFDSNPEQLQVDLLDGRAKLAQDECLPETEVKLRDINRITDLIEAMEVAEKLNVDIDDLDDVNEIVTRLKCHHALKNSGNIKTKIEGKISDLGKKDERKRTKLASMIKELRSIFPDNDKISNRQAMMEELLKQDGTTSDIREDCNIRLASLADKECVLLVSGESSAGKSSLLNLFLGENILPSHMLPCTSCITVIKYNPYRRAEVIYKDGRKTIIPNLDKDGLQQLQQRAYFSGAKKTQNAFDERKEEHDVAEIRVFLPLKMLYSGLVLVDTPGIGENEFLETYLMEYIRTHQILGFMYIIMTDNALGIAEDRLVNLMALVIRSQKSSPDVVKFNPKAALFVCNRWDMVADKYKTTVRESALKQLAKAWPDFDEKNAVFFSTFQAQRELTKNPGYVTDEFVALLHGLFNLVNVSLDKRIKASYRWLGTVLQRSVHYLRTVVRNMEMSAKKRQEKSQETKKKLKTLNQKAEVVINRLYEEYNLSVKEICAKVRLYLQTDEVKQKLTKNIGSRDGELPDMERASGTWEWVKRQIDKAFDNRLTDLLVEWDNEKKVINTLERTLFREAKLNLCDLENELVVIETEADSAGRESTLGDSGVFLNNLCRSIEDFEDDGLLDTEVPKKLIVQLTQMITKTVKKRKDEGKLKAYEKEPSKFAQKRAQKLLIQMIKEKDDRLRLEGFVRELLQRPFNYICRLENKIPSLIETNVNLITKFEKEFAAEKKENQQYISMMENVEKMRASLVKYGETNFSNDFGEDDIKILQHKSIPTIKKQTSNLAQLLNDVQSGSSKSQYSTSHNPCGIWHSIFRGEIAKGSETQHVVVKLYDSKVEIPQMQTEVAKLRCLLHNDVSIAEFLGVYQQRQRPTPALIFSGKLMSLSNYIRTMQPKDLIALDSTKLLRDILAGLQYIHSKGLVHMDLTRDSVTVTSCGEVKMTSICLSRRPIFPTLDGGPNAYAAFTNLAPEVLQDAHYTPAADLYSFAILFLEIKNHQPAFGEYKCQSLEDIRRIPVFQVLSDKIRSLPQSWPTSFKDILLKCLSKDPEARPQAVVLSRELAENALKPKRHIATPRAIFKKR